MSAAQWIVLILGVAMLVGFTVLIVLWATTEALPRLASRQSFSELLTPGEWGVRLVAPGRRRGPTMRLINDVLGGDIAAAKYLVDHPPSVVVEGIAEPVAQAIATALEETGATAEVFRSPGG